MKFIKNLNKGLVCVTTSTFAEYSKAPLKILGKSGFRVRLNPYKRKMTKAETLSLVKNAIGVIAGNEDWDRRMLHSLSNLKVISRCGTGLDSVDLKAAKKLSIAVVNTPSIPINAVAELTVGLILALLRNICLSDKELKLGIWKKRMGNLLEARKIGIVGLGKIGMKVVSIMHKFGAELSYYDIIRKNTPSFLKYRNLNQLCAWADIISIHATLKDRNSPIIGAKYFKLMKKGSFIVNCSRGELVDEKALYRALASKKIAGAALDVFCSEPYKGLLRKLDNVILTPHIGSYARETRIQMEIQAVKNLLSELSKKYKQ